MATDRERFIRELSAGHRPVRPLPLPGRRAALWFGAGLVLTALLMWAVQPYRPGWPADLARHPVFLVELVAGLGLAGLAVYLVLRGTVPGRLPGRGAPVLAAGLALVFLVALALSFTPLAPPASARGARAACESEVLVYGLVALVTLVALARRGYLRFSPGVGVMFGIGAGLVPAVLMQAACMYDPAHALHFHYAPVLLLCALGLLLNRMAGR